MAVKRGGAMPPVRKQSEDLFGLIQAIGRNPGSKNEGVIDLPSGMNSEFLFSVLMSSGEGVFGVDLDGNCTFCNGAALEMLGYGPDTVLVGRPIHDLVHRTNAKGEPCRWEQCAPSWTNQEKTSAGGANDIFWRKDGTAFPVKFRIHSIVENETVVGAVVVFSERNCAAAAERAICESEHKFRSIYEQSSLGMAILGADGHYIAANEMLCRMLGYEEHELIGRSFLDVTHPDDEQAGEAYWGRDLGGGGDSCGNEKRYLRKDGSVLWVSVTGTSVQDDEGAPVFDIHQVHDISARKAGEMAARENAARLDAIIENASGAIVLRNLEGEYVLTNRLFSEWHGISSVEALGKTVYDIFPEEFGRAEMAYDNQVLETGEPVEAELKIPFADGGIHTVLATKFPVKLSDGKILGVGTFATDITERKAVENALRDSEHRLRNAVESLHEGFALFDADDRAIITNEAYRRLNPAAVEAVENGWTFEQLLRANVERGVLKEAIGREEEFVAERLELHRRAENAISREFAGGQHFLLKETRTSDGGTALAFIDVTEQKKAEQSLRDTQSRLNTILSSAPILLWATDAEGIFTLFRGKGMKTLDFDAEAAIGKPVSEVYSDYPEVIAHCRRALGGETVDTVAKIHGRSYAIRHEPIRDEEGQLAGSVGVAIDITDRERAEEALRESEEHLRAVIENSPAAISLRDIEGRYILINREFSRWYGVSQLQVQGKHPHDLFLEAVWEPVCANDDTVIATREPLSYEHPVIDQDGHVRSGLTNKFPIVGPRGNVLGLGSVCADITEYKHMEDRLRHSQKLEAIGQLTGGVAHDFNNILAVILTNLEFLEDRRSHDISDREIITEAIQAVRRGANLTERLLSFSRKQQLRPEALDPVVVISDMVELFRRALGESISIHTEFSGGLRRVLADRGQFENALLNLAVNARDAMPQGGKLEIVVTNREVRRRKAGRINEISPGWYVGIEVRDNGEGMTEETLERAFEPFFTTKKTGQGSGLGLSMVYGFVAQSGGSISMASSIGEGSTVTLLLPAVSASKRVDAEAEPEKGPAGNPEYPTGGETILVVEDDPDVASSACRTLIGLGYKVFAARDANEALDMIRRRGGGIDLLFSDIVMPGGMNGQELAGRVRDLNPGMRICLTSGYPAGILKMDELQHSGIVFLPKPYARRTLAETVRSVLDKPEGAPTGKSI